MQGIYGAAAAANALAAQSTMVGNPFVSPPGSMIDRNFPAAGGVNPFAQRPSLTPSLTSQQFAFMRNQLNEENNQFEASNDFQKQIQQAMGLQRLLPSMSTYPHHFHPGLQRFPYYIPNPQDQDLHNKNKKLFERSESHSSSSSEHSQGDSPSAPKSPREKSLSPPEMRALASKSPEEKLNAEVSSFSGLPVPSHPFSIGNTFQNSHNMLPSLVAGGPFFRPYGLPSNLPGTIGSHGLMRPLGQLNSPPFVGPMNVPSRVPVSPTCLRR